MGVSGSVHTITSCSCRPALLHRRAGVRSNCKADSSMSEPSFLLPDRQTPDLNSGDSKPQTPSLPHPAPRPVHRHLCVSPLSSLEGLLLFLGGVSQLRSTLSFDQRSYRTTPVRAQQNKERVYMETQKGLQTTTAQPSSTPAVASQPLYSQHFK